MLASSPSGNIIGAAAGDPQGMTVPLGLPACTSDSGPREGLAAALLS